MSRESELTYAQFYIDWLNKVYNWDYQVELNQLEDSEVDVFAVSKSKNTRLKIQLVTSGGPTMKLAAINTKRLKEDKEFVVGDVEWDQWIMEAIIKKNEKYPLSVKKDLILLIEGCLPTPDPEWVTETFKTLSELPFKGIYYVSPPVASSHETAYTKHGFVVPIKDAFK